MKKILIAVIILLIIGNGFGIYYFVSYQNLKKELDEKNNVSDIKNDNSLEEEENESVPVVDAIDETYLTKKIYKSYMATSYDENDIAIKFELILYEDNTYLLGRSGYGAHMNQGTYKIKDNKIILAEKIKYGSDACYFINEELIENILTINNDKSVTYVNGSWGKYYMIETEASKLTTISSYLRNYEESMDCTNE